MQLAKAKAASLESERQSISEEAYRQLVTNELESAGAGGAFVWVMFLLCVTPNILNGFHVSSYTLLGHLPSDQWCGITRLQHNTNWTIVQQRSIADIGIGSKQRGCSIRDWDYNYLGSLGYEQALNYTHSRYADGQLPAEIDCRTDGAGSYQFRSPESTFVAEWELICDRALQRTSAQVFVSLGKFFGSFTFGIFADKFGRKSAFSLGAAFYIIASLFCTFSPWYGLFLVGRFGIGAASSGLFYPAFTMVVENICLKYRSWMSIAFSASYPIGMILLAAVAYLVQPWRYLQFALTVPSFLLILNCYLMKESPRWLIARGDYDRAYSILFKRPSQYVLQRASPPTTAVKTSREADEAGALPAPLFGGLFQQFGELYGSSKVRRMIFVSYFMFCVSSLSYYVTALNASNLSVSRYLYVAITGMVDLPSYLVPVIMLKYTGRRPTTVVLFLFTGVALLLVLAVPAANTAGVVTFAMLGRFGISGTYALVTLYTAELYPTEIRNSALGTCSTFAHVGSISAPYVVDVLGMLGWYIPTTICGCSVLVAAVLTLTLPETGAGKLADHTADLPSFDDALECDGNGATEDKALRPKDTPLNS